MRASTIQMLSSGALSSSSLLIPNLARDQSPMYLADTITCKAKVTAKLIYRKFWREVAREMKQVSWPTRTEVVNTTIVVVVAVFFFAFYLFAADLAFTYLIRGFEWAAGKVF